MNLSIKQFYEVDKIAWDAFVTSNSMGYAYHLYDVMLVDWEARSKNISFAILDEKAEIILVSPLHIYKNNLTSRWGFVLRDGLSDIQTRKISKIFIEYVDTILQKYKVYRNFSIKFPPLSEKNKPDKHNLLNPAIFFGFSPTLQYTYVVDLQKDEDMIFKNCSETTRQYIRHFFKSQEYIFINVENNPMQYFDSYIALNDDTYNRTKGWKKNTAYYRHIFNLAEKNICKLFFIQEKSTEKIIAAIFVLLYKDTAYYWWNASITEKPDFINRYLVYGTFLELKKNSIKYFETGGACPYLREGKQKGLNDFKKSFGTFLHPIYGGIFVRKKENKIYRLLRICFHKFKEKYSKL